MRKQWIRLAAVLGVATLFVGQYGVMQVRAEELPPQNESRMQEEPEEEGDESDMVSASPDTVDDTETTAASTPLAATNLRWDQGMALFYNPNDARVTFEVHLYKDGKPASGVTTTWNKTVEGAGDVYVSMDLGKYVEENETVTYTYKVVTYADGVTPDHSLTSGLGVLSPEDSEAYVYSNSTKEKLLQVTDVRWSETGEAVFYNPNGKAFFHIYLYKEDNGDYKEVYLWKEYARSWPKGEVKCDLYHVISDFGSGTYKFRVEAVHNNIEKSELSDFSQEFIYQEPSICLPEPIVTVSGQGLVTCSLPEGSDYELGSDYGFNYELYESKNGEFERVHQMGLNEVSYDLGRYMEEGKEYYIRVKTLTRNINKWKDSEWTDMMPAVDDGRIFSDVPVNPGFWKYDSIQYMYENDIMNGIKGTTRFAPDEPLTRGMFATVLYRMAGNPAVQFRDQFEDVEAGWYYSDAVIWANDNNIVQGFDGGKRFGVNERITREQIAKMLYEYGKNVQGYTLDDSADLESFPDRESVSNWAVAYMEWAVGSGMVTGRNSNGVYYLDSKGDATRAECAAMLMRFMERYK